MKIFSSIIFTLVGIGCFLPTVADAQTTTPFSHYGTIQNVQNYSSNPFWSPGAGYNQRMPQPVYATGPAVETSQCQIVVFSLVTAQCAALDNCANAQISDIRPAIMLQLSRMPGGNYATSCAGYIDTVFDEYKKQNSVAQPTPGAAFPTATAPNPNTGINGSAFPSSVQPKSPEWLQEMQERRQELKDLQAANGNDEFGINPNAQFPTTYADLSFSERMANNAEGYEPYKDKRAFTELKVESHQDYLNRQQTTGTTVKSDKNTPTTTKPALADNSLDVVNGEILFYL